MIDKTYLRIDLETGCRLCRLQVTRLQVMQVAQVAGYLQPVTCNLSPVSLFQIFNLFSGLDEFVICQL